MRMMARRTEAASRSEIDASAATAVQGWQPDPSMGWPQSRRFIFIGCVSSLLSGAVFPDAPRRGAVATPDVSLCQASAADKPNLAGRIATAGATGVTIERS